MPATTLTATIGLWTITLEGAELGRTFADISHAQGGIVAARRINEGESLHAALENWIAEFTPSAAR